MNRSVLESPKVHASQNRNYFDLSHHIIFSDSIGLLSPCMSIETIPNEDYKISMESFARSQAVNTSSFMRIKENYDFFFVPFRLLWSASDQFFSQVSNYNSATIASKYSNAAPKSIPLIPSGCFETNGSVFADGDNLDAIGIKKHYGVERIFNALEYGIMQYGAQTWLNDAMSRNPFRALAYQKIYHDFYQNNLYENIPATTYNVEGTAVLASTYAPVKEWFTLRYRDLRKDALTIVRPSFSAGSTTMPYLSDVVNNIYFNNTIASHQASNIPTRIQDLMGLPWQNGWVSGDSGPGLTQGASRTAQYINSPQSAITAQAVRAVLAFDKLATNIGVSGRDYVSQIEARYGIDIPKIRADRATFLGSYDGNVVVSEVLATNGSDLGQVGGKSTVSVNGREINFKALEHGVIMCIHSFVPYTDYYARMLDRNNIKQYFLDYYQPELDNLGSQPQYGFEVDNTQSATNQANIVGFVPRYIENKAKVSKVYGTNFANHYWTGITSLANVCTNGYSALKIRPQSYNSQFGIAFDGSCACDQFICRAQFNVTKLSPMSVYGLPNYQ